MMENIFGDAGIVGIFCIFAIMLFREVKPLIVRRQKVGEDGDTTIVVKDWYLVTGGLIRDIHTLVKELHVWHDQRDNDGVPLWYVRSSLEGAVKSLTAALETQSELLRTVATQIDKHMAEEMTILGGIKEKMT